DTGSSDGTQDLVRDFLAREGLPGEIFTAPWRDFGHNWTVAIDRLRGTKGVDYMLGMAADDRLVPEPGFDPEAFRRSLAADAYWVEVRRGLRRSSRPQLGSARIRFRCRGVLHEYIDVPKKASQAVVRGFHIAEGIDESARNRDPEKYRQDIAVLERALKTEKDRELRARYVFYLAQSHWDAGDF